MKISVIRMLNLFSFLMVATFVYWLSPSAVAAGIAGTDHDFRRYSWSGGELCIVCHVPHGNMGPVDAPLWNHSLPTQTFSIYRSGTLNAVVGQPDGDTKLCLGCHDGTVAIDSFGGAVGSRRIDPIMSRTRAGHHPVSFVYDTALANTDGNLADPSSKNTVLGGTIQHDLLRAGNRVQCTSCHDVHNRYGNSKYMKISDNNGLLCNTCHKK